MVNGEKRLKLDRGESSPTVDFDGGKWQPLEEPERELSPVQVAFVLHATDQAMARILGDFTFQEKQWLSMSPAEQQEVFDKPPGGKPARAKVWAYLKKALEGNLNGGR